MSSQHFSTTTPTLAAALAESLIGHSTRIFGLMGNGNAHLIDALERRGAEIVPVRHETATVASADAYHRVTGRLAIATTTYGAGYTNTLTPLAEAAMARTPLLLVVGDAPAAGARPMDVQQQQLAAAVHVNAYTLTRENPEAIVDRAVAEARTQRRPVVLMIPYDLPTMAIDTTAAHDSAASGVASSAAPSAAASPLALDTLSRAADALAHAERPLIIAGRGAHVAGAHEVLQGIADRLGALTSTTALARGFFNAPEFDLGITGGFGQQAAMELLSTADAVLVVGAGLNQFTMRFGELFGPGTTVIRVDIEDVNPPVTAHPIEHMLLRGDAGSVLAQLSERIAERREAPPAAGTAADESGGWRHRVTGLEPGGALRALPIESDRPDGLLDDGRLDPRALASRLAELLPENRHVTSDGGHFLGWSNMFWPVASPERSIMVGTAYQSIGLGFSTVAGVAAAVEDEGRDSTVVLTTGDGGGLMALADMETAIRTAKRCVIVVWNDGQYSAEVHLYGRMGLRESAMMIPTVDFAGIGQALGATGVRVETLHDLDALTAWREAGGLGTIVLDCRVSGSVIAPYMDEIASVAGVNIDTD